MDNENPPPRKRAAPLKGPARVARDKDIVDSCRAGVKPEELALRYQIKVATILVIANRGGFHFSGHGNAPKQWSADSKRKWREKHRRIVNAVEEEGQSIAEAAARYKKAPNTVYRILRTFRKGSPMSKQGNRDNVIADAANMGFHQRKMPPDFRRLEWTLQCSRCPATMITHWEQNMKPEAMARHARVRQWDVGYGMRPLCPDCLHGKDKGPLPKPDSQSFEPFKPKPTLISDRLIDAANKRSIKAAIPALIEKVAHAQLDLGEKREERRDARAAAEEEQRQAAQHARILDARKHRLDRLAQEDAQRAADQQRASQPPHAPNGHASPDETPQQPENAPQAEEEVMNMAIPNPSPKIQHAVFQSLESIFDPAKRLYRNGYTDQRVAKDCGTTEDIVAYLRSELYGALAEDPRVTSLRDDLELLRLESAECFARLQKDLAAAQSRLEQLAHKS